MQRGVQVAVFGTAKNAQLPNFPAAPRLPRETRVRATDVGEQSRVTTRSGAFHGNLVRRSTLKRGGTSSRVAGRRRGRAGERPRRRR